MEDFETPEVSEAGSSELESEQDGGDVHSELSAGPGGGEPPPAEAPSGQSVLRMSSQAQQSAETSASEQAYENGHEAAHASQKKKGGGTNSHNGGFTGFGAEFQPYTYTDPHMNFHKRDAKVHSLGVQHTRIFVPWNAVTNGLLGKAGPDLQKEHIDDLTQLVNAHPDDEKLKARLVKAQKQYTQDKSYTESFIKTVALAGKHTTINLTFLGAVGQPDRAKEMAHIIKYFVDHGYTNLQTTLENEPNGGSAAAKGNRGAFTRAVKHHDKAGIAAAARKYVEAYQNLHDELTALGARDQVKVVGGDMVGQNRATWFHSIVGQGLNKFVDAYSLHLYWGSSSKHPFSRALQSMSEMRKMAKKIAPGKAMEVTEFGRKSAGRVAAPRNEETAFEEGLFALSGVNDGYTSMVKWDAFYMGAHHKGDGKGDPGKFYMIDKHNKTDAMYSLMRLFTHTTEPGWHAQGSNHGEHDVESTFRSPDGHDGTIIAMSRGGRSISTAGLPHHNGKLHVHVWKNGHLHTSTVEHGGHVEVPALGAVAISTKPF